MFVVKYLVLAFLLLFSFSAIAQNDFRKMNWGDSVAHLKEKYPQIEWEFTTEGSSKIYFSDEYIGGLSTKVIYYFMDGKFQMGAYYFQEDHSPTGNLYYQDFQTISNILNEKYDMERNEKWNRSTWEGNYDRIGFSIAMGDVKIEETYVDNSVSILHVISGDKATVEHFLSYTSTNYMQSRSSTLDDF